MRVTIPTLAIATLLGGGLPAVAELGPCKADAQQTPLCGSGKGAARVVHDTISTDKKFALAWRHPDKDPAAVTEDDSDLELLLIRLADGAVLAKADTEYFRNPGSMPTVARNTPSGRRTAACSSVSTTSASAPTSTDCTASAPTARSVARSTSTR
jgi:hypothetical protein